MSQMLRRGKGSTRSPVSQLRELPPHESPLRFRTLHVERRPIALGSFVRPSHFREKVASDRKKEMISLQLRRAGERFYFGECRRSSAHLTDGDRAIKRHYGRWMNREQLV